MPTRAAPTPEVECVVAGMAGEEEAGAEVGGRAAAAARKGKEAGGGARKEKVGVPHMWGPRVRSRQRPCQPQLATSAF